MTFSLTKGLGPMCHCGSSEPHQHVIHRRTIDCPCAGCAPLRAQVHAAGEVLSKAKAAGNFDSFDVAAEMLAAAEQAIARKPCPRCGGRGTTDDVGLSFESECGRCEGAGTVAWDDA